MHTQPKQPLAAFAIVLLLAAPPAQAYLDPSTGSMVISAIVGLFASLVLAARTYWHRIKTFFRRGGRGADDGNG